MPFDMVASMPGLIDSSLSFAAPAPSPRLTRPLDQLAISLTTYCNLECKMCSVWEIRKHGVPLELAKQVVADAHALGATTLIPFGAESFMRKDFVDVLEYAHAIGYRMMSIVTNGTMITDAHLDRLQRCPSVRLNISIDGPRDIHDELRGAGMYDKAVATARQCIARGIAVAFSGVIMRETLPHVEALIDLAADVGIQSVSYQPFQTEISGAHKDIPRFSLQAETRDAIVQRLHELSDYADRRGVAIYTESLFGAVPDYLAYGKRPIPAGGCNVPSKMLIVDWRGDIYPCFFMWSDADRMGNVYRDRLADVWHSIIHKQLQMLALTERCPGCLAACSDVQTFAEIAAG
jgi:radical SAM protein with 4Fe4S-binding SPASM domain